MTETLHVMHVVLRLDVGGLERLIVDLVAEGCRHRQRVSVLCLEQPGTLASQAAAQGAHVISAGKRPGLCLTGSHAIRQVLRDMRPDVLHTHQVGALFYAGPEAHAVGIPLVVHTEHGNYIRTAQGYLQRQRVSWLWWWAARYARIFFCVSRDIAGELASRGIVPSGKLSVILNGIKTESFQKSFDRMKIVEGTMVPPGKRGFLFAKNVYEEQLKLKTARRLDKLREGTESQGETIANFYPFFTPLQPYIKNAGVFHCPSMNDTPMIFPAMHELRS